MVRTAKRIQNGVRVYGSRRNEQLPFKVLFISKKKRRQLLHWLHMSEVANGVRVVSMVRNQAIPRNLEVDGYHCKVSYYGQAKECDICEKTGHIAKDCPFRGECLRCGTAFTVIAGMSLLQQLPLVRVSCRLI